MLGLCREKQVKKVIERLKAEYEAAFREQEAAIAKLKEENRVLKAHSLALEAERENVASALIRAEQEGGRIRAEARKASSSVGKFMTQLCAIVPETGTSKSLPA